MIAFCLRATARNARKGSGGNAGTCAAHRACLLRDTSDFSRNGEALRALKRNRCVAGARRFLALLEQRLRKRGYDIHDIRNQTNRAIAHFCHRVSKRSRANSRSVFLKVVQSSSLNKSSLHLHLNRHAHLLNSRIGIAIGVQKNIFRMLYHSNWRRMPLRA